MDQNNTVSDGNEPAKQYDPYPKNAREAVDQWDAGETVWSIEMGGLGPGYEQTIQMLVIEILRDYPNNEEIPQEEELRNEWLEKVFGEKAIHRTDDTAGGYSGAQVGAAKNLAFHFLLDGWKSVMNEPALKDRHIQISNYWPKAS